MDPNSPLSKKNSNSRKGRKSQTPSNLMPPPNVMDPHGYPGMANTFQNQGGPTHRPHQNPNISNNPNFFSPLNVGFGHQQFRFPMSQHFARPPTTSGGGGSGSRPPIHVVPDEEGDDDDDDDDDVDGNLFGNRNSTQGMNSSGHPTQFYTFPPYSTQETCFPQYPASQDSNPQNPTQLNPFSQQSTQSNNPRSDHWSEAEDAALISAYIEAGGNTGIGTDQKISGLWKTIMKLFHAAHLGNQNEISSRNMDQCQGRWKRILKSVNKWLGCYMDATNLRRSGESEEDVINNARRLWQNQYNTSFHLLHAWDILKKYPKWQGGKTVNDVEAPQNSESAGSSKRSSQEMEGSSGLGVNLTPGRPEGSKRIKRKGKGIDTSSQSMESLTMAIEKLNTQREQELLFDTERYELEKKMFEYAQERDRKREEKERLKEEKVQEKRRFKIYSNLLAKPFLTAEEQQIIEKLHEEFKVV